MFADVEVNATVYVQPTARCVVYCLQRPRTYSYRIVCICKQHTVANWRTTGVHVARFRRSACVFVHCVVRRRRKRSEVQLDQRRDHGPRKMRAAVMREDATDFLLKERQAHGLACELCDELAHGFCRRAEAQVAQQVEQLFQQPSPPSSQKSAGRVTPSPSLRLSVL